VRSSTTDDVKLVEQRIGQLLWGTDELLLSTATAVRRDEAMVIMLLQGLTQITDAMEMLQDAESYLRRFAHRGRISAHRFLRLRYHITTYFNNAYVLQERLVSHLKYVERRYRKSARSTVICPEIGKIKYVLSATMRPLIDARGRYIHVRHFEDDHIERLGLTELLSKGDDESFSKAMALRNKTAFYQARKEWRVKIARYNVELSKLLDMYFHALHGVIFPNGRISYP
jgi:hypothetical protein